MTEREKIIEAMARADYEACLALFANPAGHPSWEQLTQEHREDLLWHARIQFDAALPLVLPEEPSPDVWYAAAQHGNAKAAFAARRKELRDGTK